MNLWLNIVKVLTAAGGRCATRPRWGKWYVIPTKEKKQDLQMKKALIYIAAQEIILVSKD